MDMKVFDAANAYAKAVGASMGGGAAAGAAKTSGGGGFGNLLEGMMSDMTHATKNSEAVAAKALNGKAGVVDIVTAVSNAEMVVNTVVAVRDKVVQAYQDIMKMPI